MQRILHFLITKSGHLFRIFCSVDMCFSLLVFWGQGASIGYWDWILNLRNLKFSILSIWSLDHCVIQLNFKESKVSSGLGWMIQLDLKAPKKIHDFYVPDLVSRARLGYPIEFYTPRTIFCFLFYWSALQAWKWVIWLNFKIQSPDPFPYISW